MAVLAANEWTKAAADIVGATRVRDGYALMLGIGTGRLAEELLRQTDLYVIAIDRQPEKVDRFRRKLHAAGLYGTRASAYVGDPLAYPLPPYMANLIVAEDWEHFGLASHGKRVEAVFPMLRPYGGKVCLTVPRDRRDALVREIAALSLAVATVWQISDTIGVSRDGPLRGSTDWSHAEADAAIDAQGRRRTLSTTLEGATWVAKLDARGLAFPVVIDPLWTATTASTAAGAPTPSTAGPAGTASTAGTATTTSSAAPETTPSPARTATIASLPLRDVTDSVISPACRYMSASQLWPCE